MNNRILTALFALALCLCLFIGVVPAEADAATCYHKAYETISQKPATCTEPGVKVTYYKCYSCKKTSLDSSFASGYDVKPEDLEISPLGHKWEPEHDATHHWEKCTCGATQNKVEHIAGDWIQTEAGHKKECTVCKVTIAGTLGEHRGVDVDNADGNTHRVVCKDCGFVINASVNHELSYKNNGDGTHTVTCKWCGYEEALEHVDINTNCACDKCDASLHDFSIYKALDDDKHVKACSVCKNNKPNTAAEPCKYVYTPGEVQDNRSTHTLECEVCGRGKGGDVAEYCTDGNHDCICDLCKGPMFHDWNTMATTEKERSNPATCEENGNLAYKRCKNCQQYVLSSGKVVTKEETVIEALGHDWDDAMKSGPKYHFYKCKRVVDGVPCNERKDKEEHVFDKFVSDGKGKHAVYCSVCNRAKADESGKPVVERCTDIFGNGKCECKCGYELPHTANSDHIKRVPVKWETCTEDGNIAHYRCEECGGTFKIGEGNLVPTTEIVRKATGHKLEITETRGNMHAVECMQYHGPKTNAVKCDYKAYVPHQDTNGDCKCDLADDKGNVCGAQLHTHNHKYQPAVEATCTTEGFEAYYYYAPCGRMFSDDTYTVEIKAPVSTGYADCEAGAWVNEGDNHVKYCVNCNKVVDSGAHVDANGDNRCDVCNFELALEYVAEVPATCTTSGTKAHYISRVTQRKYWDAEGTKYISNTGDLVIRAYAHIDPVTGVGPIATDKGNGTHEYTCALCNVVTRTEAHTTGGCFCTVCGAGSSAEHVATVYPYQAPVCDKDGHEAYAQCSCGQYYNAAGEKVSGYSAVSIKATGHKWGAEVFNDDAAGKHYAVCEICNAKNYGEHEVTASDPLSGNYHQFVCECGEVSLEAHYDKNGDNVCDEAGCKHDMSNKEVTVNNNPSTTVVTGDKNTVNTGWSWLRNWLNNAVGSNAGGSTTPTQTAQPGTATGSQGSTTGNNGTTTTPATGSNTGSTGAGSNAGSSTQGGNQTANATGVLQAIVSFFNWILSGFGG